MCTYGHPQSVRNLEVGVKVMTESIEGGLSEVEGQVEDMKTRKPATDEWDARVERKASFCIFGIPALHDTEEEDMAAFMERLQSCVGGRVKVVFVRQLGKVKELGSSKRVWGVKISLGSSDEVDMCMKMKRELEHQVGGHVVPDLKYVQRIICKRRVGIMMKLRNAGLPARIEGILHNHCSLSLTSYTTIVPCHS